MSAPKFTPGPWVADMSGECANVRHPDGGLIAQAAFLRGRMGWAGRRSADEVGANVRLMAAAPELLEALSAINDCISYSDTMQRWVLLGNERTRPALALVRAAIARAEGRTS
jgi:hypothetical protein